MQKHENLFSIVLFSWFLCNIHSFWAYVINSLDELCIIFPDVIRRPKPSWWANAYPDLIEWRAFLIEGVRKISWLRHDLVCIDRCLSLTLSTNVGFKSMNNNLQNIIGHVKTTHDTDAVNQNVASVMAWKLKMWLMRELIIHLII